MATPLSLLKNFHRPLSFSELDANFTTIQDDLDALNTKQWLSNLVKDLSFSDTIVISGDLILDTATLSLANSGLNISVGPLTFNQYSQVFIGGNLVLNNSNIINNGLLSVSGGIILLGTSSITGSGIIA